MMFQKWAASKLAQPNIKYGKKRGIYVKKQILSQMTLEEKISKIMVMRCAAHFDHVEALLSEGRVSILDAGIFRIITGSEGMRAGTLDEVVSKINSYIACAKNPLQLYLDAEWGIAQRFWFATRLPPAMMLGAARSEKLAYENGQVIAREARALGISIVSNPVLDVNSNPRNPIINTRAFGDNAELVIKLGAAYIAGMQEEKVIPTGKHYPGHGDTESDSHRTMPVVRKSKEALFEMELRPYQALAKEMWGVETGHILYPALLNPEEGQIPATLSRTIIHDILRKEFGFQGLIVSDSMTMRGIKETYGVKRAAVMAVCAGHDMILQDYESEPEVTLDAFMQAAESGELPMERIDESVARILYYQERVDACLERPIDLCHARSVIGCQEHQDVAQKIAESGVTLLEGRYLPAKAVKTLLIATIGEEEMREIADFGAASDSSSQLVAAEVQKRVNADVMTIGEIPTDDEIKAVLKRAGDYQHVIFASFIRVVAYKELSGAIDAGQKQLIEALNERTPAFSFLLFGSPYILKELPTMDNCIEAYGDDIHCIKAAVKVLFGEITAKGTLPVAIDARYPYGYGLQR